MRKLIIHVFIYLFLNTMLHAQIAPVHEMELSGACSQVYLHSRTGIPVFKTENSYIAINPATHQKMWEISRKNIAGITEAASEGEYSDYYEFPSTNIVFVNNNLVDVLTGNILADGTIDEIKKLSAFHLFPAKNILTVKTIAKGVYRLYGIDAINSKLLWKSDIDELGGLSLAAMGSADPMTETRNGLKPYINESGDIIYVHQKNMMLIDHKSGKVKWSQSLEPGAILFSRSGKMIAVAEKRSGLGAAFNYSDPKFSKRLVVVDAATGEDAWKKEIKLDGNILFIQPYRDGFIAAHEEGFNIYNFNSSKAEPEWKKDFSAKEISDIVEEGDNIMVYYKNRRMLMDPVTGDEVWKKPEKLDEEVPVFTGGNTNNVGDVRVTHSGTGVRLHNPKTKAYRYFPAHVLQVAPQHNAVVGVFVTQSDLPPVTYFTFYHADLSTMKVTHTQIDMKRSVSGIHVTPDGYFVYGPQSYSLIKIKDGKPVITKEEKFPDPSAFERGLVNAAMAAAGMTYIGTGLTAGSAYVVGDAAAYNSYIHRMDALEIAGEYGTMLRTRPTLARIDKQYAFFFSRDDAGNLALFQLNKDNAEQVAKYKFDDKTPVYEIDYINGRLYYMNGKKLKIFILQA